MHISPAVNFLVTFYYEMVGGATAKEIPVLQTEVSSAIVDCNYFL